MKAAYYCGDRTVEIGECRVQSPSAGQVRIEVAYCGVCGTDIHIYLGHQDRRIDMPQVIGHEMSGRIAEVGADVEGWAVGDPVVVRPLEACGACPACNAGNGHICQNLNFIGIDSPGAFQGSWTVPAHTLHRLPDDMSLTLGALVEPLAVACHDVRLGEVAPGERVVVIGGGPIGLLNALVAQHAGAEVRVAEVNAYRLKAAHALGLETVHPLEEDLVAHVEAWTGGGGADAVFEVSGSQAGAEVMTKLAKVRGRIVVVAIFADAPKVDLFQFFWRELKMCGVRVYEPEDYDRAIELAASGALPLNELITEHLPLDALPDAFARLAAGTDAVKILIDTQGGRMYD